MAEPMAAAVRKSLFSPRSAFQGTSSVVGLKGGAIHRQQQSSLYSSNLFEASPRQAKGKEKEREELCTRRVLQSKEWSCYATRLFNYCSAHSAPFMLQELLPSRQRPVRRFQNPRVQPTNRQSKITPTRPRSLLGTQQRHASHTAFDRRIYPPSRTQSGISTFTNANMSTSTSNPMTTPSLADALELITHVSMRDEVALKDFSLEDAWEAFDIVLDNPGCISTHQDKQKMLCFIEQFCDKLELFYEEDDTFDLLKKHRESFRQMTEWLEDHLKDPSQDELVAIRSLVSRCRATYGQHEAAIELLEEVRGMRRKSHAHPSIGKAYQSIFSSIFYYKNGIHVIRFLDQHFFFEYFRPPVCFFFRDRDDASIDKVHRRLLYILSTIKEPADFVASRGNHSRDWPKILVILILAYCHHKLPELAYSVYKKTQWAQRVLTSAVQLRLVRSLAQVGLFDLAYEVFDKVPESAPGYLSAGAHVFALQGDYPVVRDYFAVGNSRHEKGMRLLSMAVQGRTLRLRKQFDIEFPMSGSGEYQGDKPGAMDYAIAIFAHARRSNPMGIAYWMDRMNTDSIQPNLYIYSSVIESYLRSGNLGAVADVLNKMREARVVPNAVIYTNIIAALNRHHKPSTAEGIFKRALREDVKPDQVMVGALMNCYVEAGQWDEAVKLFKALETNSRSPLHLTIAIYNIAMKGYVMMGAPFRVVATLFERLDASEDVTPTSTTFALLLQSACESGNMRAALDIFREMEKRATAGAKDLLNPYVFTILISGFLRKGNKDLAMAMYQEMVNRGIKPTSVTFNAVLKQYANDQSENSLRMAYEFMSRVAKQEEDGPIIAEDNLRLSHTQLVYEPLLRSHATNGDVEGFERLLKEFLDAGGQMSIPTLTTLLSLYRRKGRLESATKVWEHMLELGEEAMQAARLPTEGKEEIEPFTDMLCKPLTIYLDLLSEIGEYEAVLQTWQAYHKRGFSFNFFNWNRLGTYLVYAGEYDRAFEVLDQILLPYSRIRAKQIREALSPSTGDTSAKSEGNWQPPFEVLNNTELSFLRSTILPNRPMSTDWRVRHMRIRSSRGEDDSLSSMALNTFSVSDESSPSATADLTTQTAPPSTSEEPGEATDSLSRPSSPTLQHRSTPTPESLDPSAVPAFVQPLLSIAHSDEVMIPRPHFSLLQNLLIGYQRLRAGQRAVASNRPNEATDADFDCTAHTPEMRADTLELFRKITRKYPDAVEAVLEFEQKEREKLGDSFAKLYIWA